MAYCQFVGVFLSKEEREQVFYQAGLAFTWQRPELEFYDIRKSYHVVLKSRPEPWEAQEAERRENISMTASSIYYNPFIQTIPVEVDYPHEKRNTNLVLSIRTRKTNPHLLAHYEDVTKITNPNSPSCFPSYGNHLIKSIDATLFKNESLNGGWGVRELLQPITIKGTVDTYIAKHERIKPPF